MVKDDEKTWKRRQARVTESADKVAAELVAAHEGRLYQTKREWFVAPTKGEVPLGVRTVGVGRFASEALEGTVVLDVLTGQASGCSLVMRKEPRTCVIVRDGSCHVRAQEGECVRVVPVPDGIARQLLAASTKQVKG